MTADRDGVGDDEVSAIAVSALKYADLSNDRVHDYTFDPERMVKLGRQHRPVFAVRPHPRCVGIAPCRAGCPTDRSDNTPNTDQRPRRTAASR